MTRSRAGFFTDKHGNRVIMQKPNLPILGWLALTLINYAAHSSQIAWLATALLFTWAFMELYQGDSYFRRLLGLVVIAAILIAHWN